LSALGFGERLCSVLRQSVRVIDNSRRADDTLNKSVLFILTVNDFSLLLSLLKTAFIKLLSAHFHLSLMLLCRCRSFDFTITRSEVSVESLLLGFESRVDVLVSSIHVDSKFCTRLSLMEVVRNWNSRLFTLLCFLHGSDKGLLESTEIRDRLRRARHEVERHLNF